MKWNSIRVVNDQQGPNEKGTLIKDCPLPKGWSRSLRRVDAVLFFTFFPVFFIAAWSCAFLMAHSMTLRLLVLVAAVADCRMIGRWLCGPLTTRLWRQEDHREERSSRSPGLLNWVARNCRPRQWEEGCCRRSHQGQKYRQRFHYSSHLMLTLIVAQYFQDDSHPGVFFYQAPSCPCWLSGTFRHPPC